MKKKLIFSGKIDVMELANNELYIAYTENNKNKTIIMNVDKVRMIPRFTHSEYTQFEQHITISDMSIFNIDVDIYQIDVKQKGRQDQIIIDIDLLDALSCQ